MLSIQLYRLPAASRGWRTDERRESAVWAVDGADSGGQRRRERPNRDKAVTVLVSLTKFVILGWDRRWKSGASLIRRSCPARSGTGFRAGFLQAPGNKDVL